MRIPDNIFFEIELYCYRKNSSSAVRHLKANTQRQGLGEKKGCISQGSLQPGKMGTNVQRPAPKQFWTSQCC